MTDFLTSFRRNAVHVRQALAGRPSVQTTSEAEIEGYKRISIPVRRALNANDRASFAQALAAIDERPGGRDAAASARAAWARLQQELDSEVGLGGSRVRRGEILTGWLAAAAFYDTREREHAYDEFIDRWGKAAEGIGAQLMDDAAQAIVMLDEAVAGVLGEPVILPPPQKTPAPPKDPEARWWKRFF